MKPKRILAKAVKRPVGWIEYFPCRCKKCRARKTLKKHPDDYVNRPWHCKSWNAKAGKFEKNYFVVDECRRRNRKVDAKYRSDPGPLCTCDQVPWRERRGTPLPHRAGSHKNCVRYGVPF